MKCPNCKCIVPSNVSHCNYCGYEIIADKIETMKVIGLNGDDFYDENFINYTNNNYGYFNTPWEIYGNVKANQKKRRRKSERPTIDGDVMFISIMVGLTCIGIILSLLLLVV